ncbi:hypothetical protein [Bacillus sp. FJAT-22090]|uniref:hypothetical protein n=1 Tax=Bacillus sp. FJAT-22090 TaxID=1581038 RepID=UPI0012E2C5F8|nr:hypothetical protein [Bacillus sp. FJAT-22090]
MWRHQAFTTGFSTCLEGIDPLLPIGLQSMYQWMKRLASESNFDAQPTAQWMALSQSSSHCDSNSSLRIHIDYVSIEIQEDFNRALLQEVIEILLQHVK